MSAYVPLLSLAVQHRYFGSGKPLPLEFVPTGATQVLIRNFDLLLRTRDGSLVVYCRDEDMAGLRQPADTDGKSLMLEFKVMARDRNFARYTSPLASMRDEVLYLDSWRATKDAYGRLRLHAGESVDDSYFEDWHSPLIQSAVTTRDALVRPVLIVNLSINEGNDASADAPAYYVDFASYTSYWKYYFVGEIGKRKLSIADLGGDVEFTSLGMTEVVNGEALTFVSSSPIPMQDVPPQRFQLLENGDMGEKVLIKRLPNAAIGQVSKEKVKQEAALVSEMYIN